MLPATLHTDFARKYSCGASTVWTRPVEPVFSPVSFALALFVGMIILLALGRHLGIKRHLDTEAGERESLGTIEGALFGVFGLLMAFTFSGAAERFGEKRMLVAEEARLVETAYLRLQVLPEKEREALQELYRRYVDSRLETYRRLPDMRAATVEMAESKRLQKEIWTRAVAAARLQNADLHAGEVLLPALNDSFNIATTRTMALQAHPPRIVFQLLFVLGLLCALLVGYRLAAGRRWNWLHILGFTVITVIVVYVILDIEYPRGGLLTLENADQVLVKVREDMN